MTGTADREMRQDIEDVLIRYATGIDRRDWALFRTCFTDDCDIEYPGIGTWRTADEITEWMCEVHEPCGHTLHRITNIAVTPTAAGADASAYVDALVMFTDNQAGTRAMGSYDDQFVLTADGWKITRRRFTVALLQLVPDGTVLDLGG